MVCHAQQLSKIDAALGGLNALLMHEGDGTLNALLVMGCNHDLSICVVGQPHQQISTPASRTGQHVTSNVKERKCSACEGPCIHSVMGSASQASDAVDPKVFLTQLNHTQLHPADEPMCSR